MDPIIIWPVVICPIRPDVWISYPYVTQMHSLVLTLNFEGMMAQRADHDDFGHWNHPLPNNIDDEV